MILIMRLIIHSPNPQYPSLSRPPARLILFRSDYQADSGLGGHRSEISGTSLAGTFLQGDRNF